MFHTSGDCPLLTFHKIPGIFKFFKAKTSGKIVTYYAVMLF